MKRILISIIAFAVVFSLVACGGGNTSASNSDSESKIVTTTVPKETNRLDALKEEQEKKIKEQEAEEEAKKQAEQAKKDSITTNTNLLNDLTKEAWGSLYSDGHLLYYISFDDDGDVYFGTYYDNPPNVIYDLNKGEYAFDEEKSEIVVFWEDEGSKKTLYQDSSILYTYENGKLKLEGGAQLGTSIAIEDILIDYYQDKDFSEFYYAVLDNNGKIGDGASVAEFYSEHPDYLSKVRDR